jgi:predicted RNA-binding Zn ribbon-like protein
MAEIAQFDLVAGHVSLDFANTLDNRYSPAGEIELLKTYADVLRFGVQSGVLIPTQARSLRRFSENSSAKSKSNRAAEAVLRSAVRLREAIDGIFRATARHKRPAAADLAVLNNNVRGAVTHHRIAPAIVRGKPAFAWQWDGFDSDLAAALWPVAQGAAELLASSGCSLVRECHSVTCRWLFLDHSKNHSRRWCDMKTCGNRNKARRYYHKLAKA